MSVRLAGKPGSGFVFSQRAFANDLTAFAALSNLLVVTMLPDGIHDVVVLGRRQLAPPVPFAD